MRALETLITHGSVFGEQARTGLAEHLLQKHGHPRFRLPKAAHQQRHQRHQSRTGLADGHAQRQHAARRRATSSQPMPLILGYDWLDLGQFPHLMPQRLGIAAREFVAAAPAFGRLENLNVVAIATGQQRPLVFLVARLAAAPILRLRLAHRRFGMWVLARRRQRGVSRRLAKACFQGSDLGCQFLDPHQQQPYSRLRLGRLTRDQFFRDFQRHDQGVAEIPHRAKTSFSTRAVNGYLFGQSL